MKVRHRPGRVETDERSGGDPKWTTALIVGAVSIATLAITRSAQDVPVVVGSVLVVLGVAPRVT